MLINYESIKKSKLVMEPYQHSIITNLLNIRYTQLLIDTMPRHYFKLVKRNYGSDKKYSVMNAILYNLEDQKVIGNLPEPWLDLISSLTSSEYKEAVSELIRCDLTKTYIEITAKEYMQNQYISPHTDRSSVPATHVVFLNTNWHPKWGGEFCIHDESGSIVTKVLPKFNQSVLFKQGANSWHSVSPIRSEMHSRIGLQIAFWKNKEKITPTGREIYELT